MDIEIIKTLGSFSILQIGVWVYFLIRYKKANQEQRLFLLRLTMVFAFFITGILFLVFGRSDFSYYMANISNTSIMLVLPLVYFYIADSMKLHSNSYAPIHYLPFTFVLALTIIMLKNSNEQILTYNAYSILFIGLFYAQCIFYFLLIFRKTDFKIFEKPTRHEAIFVWLRPFLIGLTIIMFVKASIFISWNVFQLHELCVFLCTLFLLASFVIINMLIIFTLLKKESIFLINKYESISNDNKEIEKSFQLIMDELITKMEYRNPLINLNTLSKKTGLPANRISMVINEKTGKNFNELINAHRIDEAKKMIVCKQNGARILEIAYEVGFNSKSTFNTAFKKYTGLTPSEFKLKYS